MLHSISGPHRGHFIAAYACPVGEFGQQFIGCFKIFPHLPKCYCERGQVADGVGSNVFDAAHLALLDGEAAGRRASNTLEACLQWDLGIRSTVSGTHICTCRRQLIHGGDTRQSTR